MVGGGVLYVAGGSKGEAPDLAAFGITNSSTGSIASSAVMFYRTSYAEARSRSE